MLLLFDSRHRFVFSYTWSLPFWQHGQNWYQYALGNWQVGGIVTAMSGTPFTVFDYDDYSLQGGAPEITGFQSNRPNLVGNPNAGPKTTDEWFNTAAFAKVTDPGTFGTAGRNIVQGPGYANWDFSALKNFKITESKQFQFRAEFFNILNHANLRLPDSDFRSRNFGKILSALILGIGFIMIAFTEQKQGLHDTLAGTLVLKGQAPTEYPLPPNPPDFSYRGGTFNIG